MTNLGVKAGREVSMAGPMHSAWIRFKRHWKLFGWLLLSMFAGWVVLEAVVIFGMRVKVALFGLPLWIVAHAAFLLFTARAQATWIRASVTIQDGSYTPHGSASVSWPLALRFLAAQLLYLAVVLAGFALFIVPGIYLMIRFCFVGFILVTTECGVLKSFSTSARLAAGIQWQLLRLIAGLFALNGLGLAFLGVGIFPTLGVSGLRMAAEYRRLAS
jgi:hypothetical protein